MVVIGAGFAGVSAARRLKRADVDVTVIDKTTHHLFQPLLYQVATARQSLQTPGDAAGSDADAAAAALAGGRRS